MLQVFVHGDSLKACLVAVVVPDPDVAIPWAKKELCISNVNNIKELCENSKFNEALLKDIEKSGKGGGLHKFELPRAIYLHPEPFSIENGLLTPTFKTKR